MISSCEGSSKYKSPLGDGPVVKNPPARAEDVGSSLSPGSSYVPQGN